MTEHFADIKQAAVCGILAALQKYDPAIGAPFAAFQKRYIQDGVGDYIRTAQSGVITMTADTYPVMRRIMAIYHLSGDNCGDDSVQRIADETGMGEKSVRKYITIGTLNERRVDFTGSTMRMARKRRKTFRWTPPRSRTSCIFGRCYMTRCIKHTAA